MVKIIVGKKYKEKIKHVFPFGEYIVITKIINHKYYFDVCDKNNNIRRENAMAFIGGGFNETLEYYKPKGITFI